MARIVPFEPEYVGEVAELASRQGYPTYGNPDSALETLLAPGAYGLVALDDDTVVGFAHVSSNRRQAYLWTIVVAERHRRRGIGRQLIHAAFEATDANRMDLLAVPESRRSTGRSRTRPSKGSGSILSHNLAANGVSVRWR